MATVEREVVGGAAERVPERVPWLAINALGLYVTLMYGITYYAVTTAAPRIADDMSITVSTVFGLLTVALLVTAGLAPRIGRWTDRVGAATVLLVGAGARAVALLGMALAPDLWLFGLAFVIVQILGQLTEYDATFAAAVNLAGDRARAAMSQITLWGGLASTAFWPVTAAMLQRMTWREMFLIFAAVLLVVCVPIAGYARSLPNARPARDKTPAEPAASQPTASATEAPPPAEPAVLRAPPPFMLVAAAFALGGVAYNLPALMLPVLEGLGLGASAVVVGMVFGPSQTAGRLLDMLVGSRVHAITVAMIASAMVALALLILMAGNVWAGLAFAVLFGAGAGVGYVVRGSVVLALYGTASYASWLGRLSTVRLLVTAMSPLVLALVLENLGARAVILVCIAAALLSLACFVAIYRKAA